MAKTCYTIRPRTNIIGTSDISRRVSHHSCMSFNNEERRAPSLRNLYLVIEISHHVETFVYVRRNLLLQPNIALCSTSPVLWSNVANLKPGGGCHYSKPHSCSYYADFKCLLAYSNKRVLRIPISSAEWALRLLPEMMRSAILIF
jgi:hypothetical protein